MKNNKFAENYFYFHLFSYWNGLILRLITAILWWLVVVVVVVIRESKASLTERNHDGSDDKENESQVQIHFCVCFC
jgi:uncharacterized membrane protein